ncbi:response regulator [Pseudocolwellia sp. HL-MZ19]|uniref:response regulator n=1 Tax=unclassified Pseudocolwellia TaxID=2848178 RepID=UPI003CE71F2E
MISENIASNIPLTVLCVDDEVNILKSMKRLLHKQGYQLLLAESGLKALEIIQQQKVHLVISDMRMPNMSGDKLLENIATLSPDTYRVLLTGYSDIKSTIVAGNKGKIHRYISKPWDNKEIIKTIENALENVRV